MGFDLCYPVDNLMRRILVSITVVCLFVVSVQNPWSQDHNARIRRSVVAVVDCSYSMRIEDSSRMRRFDILKRTLRSLLSKPASKTEWALVAFSDSDSVSILCPFTDNPSSLLPTVDGLEIGRLSPIEKSLTVAADYLSHEGQGSKKTILLLSDGVSTEHEHFQFLLSSSFEQHKIQLFILGFPSPHDPLLSETLVRLARYTGGDFYTFDRVEQLRERLFALEESQESRYRTQRVETSQPKGNPSPKPQKPEVESDTNTPVIDKVVDSGSELNVTYRTPLLLRDKKPGSRISLVLLWVPLVGLLLILLSILLQRRARSQEQRLKQSYTRRRTFLSLSIQYPNMRVEALRLEKSPVTIGNNPSCDIRLSMKSGKWQDVFTYTWDRAGAYFESKRAFLLNGVAVKNKVLRSGDRLKFGNYYLTFNGLQKESVQVPAVGNYSYIPLSAGCFLVILSVLLASIKMAHTIPEKPSSAAIPLSRASLSGGSEHLITALDQASLSQRLLHRPSTNQPAEGIIRQAGKQIVLASGVSPVESPLLREDGSSEEQTADDTEISRERPVPEEVEPHERVESYKQEAAPKLRQVGSLERYPIRVVAPWEDVDYFKADILFLHAHPDDESLDFAGLMAKARRYGKRIAIVLFTDGESGLDQFPNRGIDGTYPAQDLLGDKLASVRVEEAKAALSILGSEVYIRLGLLNHPYNTSKDYLPIHTVIGHWGGERILLERLRRIIEGFRPEVVVSSDFNTEAYEHFEHKAVGRMVRYTLRYLMSGGYIKGYLVSVDPFQRKDLYPSLERVDMMERDRATGLTYREIQYNALKEHRTQGDASLIGVELLPHFRWEQYYPVIWKLNTSLEGYIKGSK
jgi:LmbE family N-acetylglucosaminyl deacetylase